MSRLRVVFLCALQVVFSSALGQEQGAVGSLLPAPQSPTSQVSSRFLLAERNFDGVEATQNRLRAAILQFVDDESVDLNIECRKGICRAAIITRSGKTSIARLWEAKGSSELLGWEKSVLVDLANEAGFDGAAPIKLSYSDGSRQLLLYVY
jgi:hypothetical protein